MADPKQRDWPVRITTLGPIQGGTVAFSEAGVTYVTVVVKATFALIHEAFAVQTAPEPLVLADEPHAGSTTLDRASDLAPFVPAVDVILRGRAHGEGGASVPAVATRLVMTSSEVSGAEVLIDKTVHVYGKRARVGAYPDGFASFPLVYDFAEQPAPGVGFGTKPGEVPHLVLPNGERGYAGFGPIAPAWPDRQELLEGARIDVREEGGVKVLDLGSDAEGGAFPFEYFQVSPPDQRLTGLEGGEWIVIDGMHRDLPRFATKLPHMRAEAQLYDPDGRPLPMHLVCDTLAVDMEARTMNALFRGNIPAPAGPLEALSVVATLEVLANEDLDSSISSYGSGASFADLAEDGDVPAAPSVPVEAKISLGGGVLDRIALDSMGLDDTPMPGEDDALPPLDPADATAIVPSPLLMDPDPPPTAAPPERRTVPPPAAAAPSGDMPFRASTTGPSGASETRGLPFALGARPLADDPTPENAAEELTTGLPFVAPLAAPGEPAAPAPPSVTEPITADAVVADDSSDDEPPTRMRASIPDIVAAASPPPESPASAPERRDPSALDAPTTVDEHDPRAVIVKRLAKGEALYDANFAGADLTGLDFRGAALTGINLTNAKLDGCRFDGARLGSAKLAGASLVGATFVGAELGQADLSKCKLAGARFDDARLDDANLALVDAPNASFQKAAGQRVALAQGHFHEARFDGATLTYADCSGSDFAGATFDGAGVASGRFADARAKGASFRGADLDQATFVGAELVDACFDGAAMRASSLERAKLEGCSFREAKLQKAIFARSTIARCVFAKAELDGSNFIHASGEGADFQGASLVGADLRQTKLADMRFDGADLRRINAHKAALPSATFDGANLGGASLRGAKLKSCSLAGADLADADLRDADLEGAKLLGIVNRDRAKLGGANLKGAEDDAPAEPPPEA